MATNVTVKSVLEKISEGHLECSICTNRFRQPKVLDCLHSFCLICLQELGQRQDPSNTKLTCPLCRCETILEGSGVADLPNNFTLTALVEEVTMQEKLLEGQGSEIKCQACDEENQAISRCMGCDHFLCQECQKAHGRMAHLTKSHKIYTLAQLQSGEIVYKSKLREEVPKCGKHPDQNLNVYCNTCEQVICLMCTVLDHGNPKHSLIGLPEALEKCKKSVAELVAKVEKSKTELGITMQETDGSRNKLDTMFADTKQKITKRADEEVAKIREEEQNLLQEVERIYRDRVTTFENSHAANSKEVTQAEHKLDEVKHLMAQASCHEILELQQKLLHNLSELTGKQPEKVPDSLSFLNFEDGESSLGRIVLEEESKTLANLSLKPGRLCSETKWELKSDIKNFGEKNTYFSQVAALSSNKIYVVLHHDIYHSNKSYTISLAKSKHEPPIEQRLHMRGLYTASDIAVSKDDKLITIDGGTVHVLNKKHEVLHRFIPGEGLQNDPTSLAVDDSNTIAVGYERRAEVYLYNPDGSLIRRLPAPMFTGYMTIYKQRLIYTCYSDDQQLLSVDYYGAKIFSVDMTGEMQKYGRPKAVCCDSDGSIYVAMNEYSGSEILHYSPDGKYLGHMISGSGYVYDIKLTSDGDLAVAADASVKIYHRV